MKVKELIAKLNNYDPEAPVHYAYAYRDTWLAAEIHGVQQSEIVWSFLYECPKLSDNPTEKDFAKEAVVLFP